jgi:DNA-binding transcriptional LysR family regulator
MNIVVCLATPDPILPTRLMVRAFYLPSDQVQDRIDAGRLVRALGKFTPGLPGYHLYYPNRRHASAAFRRFVDAVRYRN